MGAPYEPPKSAGATQSRRDPFAPHRPRML